MSFEVSRLGLLNQPALRDGSREISLSTGGPSFAETLKGYLEGVAELETNANLQVEAMARGEATDPHEIMLAVEEANLALDLLLEIRNKLLEAYQELTRTPL